MFRRLLGHLQAIWENRYKSYLYFNALWDPKCLQVLCYMNVKYIYLYKLFKYIYYCAFWLKKKNLYTGCRVGKGKVQLCKGTEALCRPYGP